MASDPADRAGAVLEIDLAGIVANWRLLAERVEPARCAAVIKADAYGLGAPQVSAALAAAGCRLFFVASLDEGIALRNILPASCEIAVFNGPVPGSAEEFVSHRLIPILNEPGQIAAWADELKAQVGGERVEIFYLVDAAVELGVDVEPELRTAVCGSARRS